MQGEYNFAFISVVTLGVYAMSLYLVWEEKIKLVQHRRFWNVILLTSFLLSGPLGFLMSFIIDNGIRIAYYSTVLWLHVEAGIVMAVVGAIHALWHWRYFVPRKE
jgi:protein-S-isoprenylcysteine O-methyltransferase Ste14